MLHFDGNLHLVDPNAVRSFGTPLETLMQYEKSKWPDKDVPLLVQKCLDYLTIKGYASLNSDAVVVAAAAACAVVGGGGGGGVLNLILF